MSTDLKQRIGKLEASAVGSYLDIESVETEVNAIMARLGPDALDSTFGSPALQKARRELREMADRLSV